MHASHHEQVNPIDPGIVVTTVLNHHSVARMEEAIAWVASISTMEIFLPLDAALVCLIVQHSWYKLCGERGQTEMANQELPGPISPVMGTRAYLMLSRGPG